MTEPTIRLLTQTKIYQFCATNRRNQAAHLPETGTNFSYPAPVPCGHRKSDPRRPTNSRPSGSNLRRLFVVSVVVTLWRFAPIATAFARRLALQVLRLKTPTPRILARSGHLRFVPFRHRSAPTARAAFVRRAPVLALLFIAQPERCPAHCCFFARLHGNPAVASVAPLCRMPISLSVLHRHRSNPPCR